MINTFYLADLINNNIVSAIWTNKDNPQSDNGYIDGEPPLNIYPCVAFPNNDGIYNQRWITFKRISTTPSYTKDGLVCDKVEFQINVACGSYSESTVFASYIREHFCKACVLQDTTEEDEVANTFLKHCELIDASEDFERDVYIQQMVFSGEVYFTEKKEQARTTTED